MEKSIISFCFLFLAIQVASGHNVSSSSWMLQNTTNYPFIKNVCDQAHQYDHSIDANLCIRSLHGVPDRYRDNLPGLLKILSTLGDPHLKEATESASGWLKIANDPKMKESLLACIESLVAGTNVMVQMAAATGTANYAGVIVSLSGAVQGAFECEEKTTKGPADPVLIEGLTDAQLYLSIAKAFVHIITEQQQQQ